MKRGEVWWVNFDPAQGSEINKLRPVVIVSNDSANRNLPRVVVVPLSNNISKIYPSEAVVKIGAQSSKAMVDQIMAADKSRLKHQIGNLSKPDLKKLEDAIHVHLGLAK